MILLPPINFCYLFVECPKCGARPRLYCETMGKRPSYILVDSHKERREAYEEYKKENK